MADCSFCDPELPDGRIPACTRPAVKKIRGMMCGEPEILDVCQVHFDKMKDGWPIERGQLIDVTGKLAGAEAIKKEVVEHLERKIVHEYFCKGCGETIFKTSSPGLFGLEVGGLDVLAATAHLNVCVWRRKKMS